MGEFKEMIERILRFCQEEYTRILDQHNARIKGFSQTECEKILMDAGASYHQAKNGAYVYLCHGNYLTMRNRGSQVEYDQILDNFCTRNKSPKDCIRHLEIMGFSYSQAKTAVYKYRVSKGLIIKSV